MNFLYPGRWGGEEFLVIVEADAQHPACDAVAAAGHFLVRLRETDLLWEQHAFRVTASVGLARRRRGEPVQSWLARADAALYTAKAAGRDRLVVAQKP